MTVSVHRGAVLRVAQTSGNGQQVDSIGKHMGSSCVAQVVEAHLRQVSDCKQFLKSSLDLPGPVGSGAVLCEHQMKFFPIRIAAEPVMILEFPMFLEDIQSRETQLDRALTRFGFGCAEHKSFSTNTFQLAADGQRAFVPYSYGDMTCDS